MTSPTQHPETSTHGVGPWVGDLPTDARYDPELLVEGDSRNVVDAYRYWTMEAIVADLDTKRHSFHVAIENWQHVEKDYWINVLGKQAAIEIIANGKPDLDTMTKMVKLPEDAYVKATQICVKLANAIAAATEDAEAEIGFMADLPEKKVATGPRQLKLKKVK